MMTSRQRKALVVYHNRTIIDLGNDQYVVQGRKNHKTGKRAPSYNIQQHPNSDELTCNCPGFGETHDCKHLQALLKWLAEGPPKVGYDNLDENKRPTYPQDLPRYRASRRVMMTALPLVLRAFLRYVFPLGAEPRGKAGRPRLPLSDLVWCILIRITFGVSGDIAQAFVDDAFRRKILHHPRNQNASAPAVSTITSNMRREHVAAALVKLIKESNKSYQDTVTRIGIDGAEFNCPTLSDRNGEHSKMINIMTVKLHSAVDVDSGMVVAAVVTTGKSSEAREAIGLLDAARDQRFVTHLSADKAYPSAEILEYCENHKIRVSIPPKSNARLVGDSANARHAREWYAQSDEDKALYGRRQLTEAMHSRMKRLMGENLKGRQLEAQIVEVLSRVLLVNVRLLIESYVAGDIELPFLDSRSRRVLDPVRESLKKLPRPDLSPRHRDGFEEQDAA